MPYRGVMTGGNNGQSVNNNSTTLTLPGAAVAGDAALIIVTLNVNTATVTTPTGFTVLSGPNDQATNMRSYLFGKVLTAGDISGSTITVGISASQVWDCMGNVYSGNDQTNPFGTAALATTAGPVSSLTVPALTTASGGSDVGMYVATRKSTATAPVSTLPGTYTKDGESLTAFGAAANTGAAAGHLTTPVATSTAVGGGTVAISPTGSGQVYLIELLPRRQPVIIRRPQSGLIMR